MNFIFKSIYIYIYIHTFKYNALFYYLKINIYLRQGNNFKLIFT